LGHRTSKCPASVNKARSGNYKIFVIEKNWANLFDWIQKTGTQELARTFKKCGMDFLDDDQDLFARHLKKSQSINLQQSRS